MFKANNNTNGTVNGNPSSTSTITTHAKIEPIAGGDGTAKIIHPDENISLVS